MPVAVQTSHAKAMEALRHQGRKKNKTERQGLRPKLGAGKTVIKSQKEVAESELATKLAENEERKRQWLMAWHIEVDQMQTDLWDMEQTLANSLVRTESAKKRDKEKRSEVEKPQMTEEEIEKLPVRMRPRPKYQSYRSEKERSDLNDMSFSKMIRNFHDHPRRFDAMTPDDYGSSRMATSRFPQVQVSSVETEKYKVLLLKNPFYKDTERNNMLMRSKTDFLQVPSFLPGKPYFKQPPGNTARSADVKSASTGATKLPSLKIPSMPDLRPEHIKDQDTTLPKLGLRREGTQLSPVKEAPAITGKEKSSAATLKRSASPAISLSSIESFGSDESGFMMAAKAKRQREKAKKAAEKMAMPAKNEPNLLDNADFRKTLIQQLDDKRQERQQDGGSKWGLVKKTVGGMLKIKMPDVIKDAAKNKHKNRAVEQVQERIKRRNSLAPGAGLSQSMTALDQIGKK